MPIPIDTRQPATQQRDPLDLVRDAALLAGVLGVLGESYTQSVVQTASTYILWGGIGLAAFTVVTQRWIGPLIGRWLDRSERASASRLLRENITSTGIVFHRRSHRIKRLLARLAGKTGHDWGYMVFMQCPDELWFQGGIGEATAIRKLALPEEVRRAVLGIGSIGLAAVIADVKEFVNASDRRIVLTASSIPELIGQINANHDMIQQLILPDAKAVAEVGCEGVGDETATERVERVTYQLDTMMKTILFLQTLHERLTTTDIERIKAEDIYASSGPYDIDDYPSLPLLIEGDTRVEIRQEVGDMDRHIDAPARMFVLGYAIALRGDINDERSWRRTVEAVDYVAMQSGKPIELNDMAAQVVNRLDEVNHQT